MKTLLLPCLLAIYGMIGCTVVPSNTQSGGSRAAFVDEVGSGEEEQLRRPARRFEPVDEVGSGEEEQLSRSRPVDEVGSGEEEAAEEYRNRRRY